MHTTRRAFSFGIAAVGLSACVGGSVGSPGAKKPETRLLPVPNPAFDAWVEGFRARAAGAGISAAALQTGFRGVGFLPGVIEKDRNQTEFTRSLQDYLAIAASDERVSKGRAAFAAQGGTLAEIEARYGVEPHVVTAIWGLESFYGERRGNVPVISALSTLAFEGRRGPFFEQQLIAALKIIQNGDTTPEQMTGSWAGAMGHTQFMPSSYLATAVDFNADGRRDIWSDDPADALASTAAYLAKAGWKHGHLWGVEVRLPDGFDYDNSGDRVTKTVADWQVLGVRLMDGADLPDDGLANIRLPGGAKGAAFLTFANFRAIEAYNAADAYVIGIGHLAARLAGGPAIQHPWPREDRALQLDERVALQRLLTGAGFDSGGADGKIGPKTIAAIKAFQRSLGLLTDGYASLDVLTRLQKM